MWSAGVCVVGSLLVIQVSGFVSGVQQQPPTFVTSSSSLHFSAVTTETKDDLLKPAYEVEQIPLRIGHGFDIHRMAPIEEAGQPVVIGGVEITHKDQKVCLVVAMWIPRQPVVSKSCFFSMSLGPCKQCY